MATIKDATSMSRQRTRSIKISLINRINAEPATALAAIKRRFAPPRGGANRTRLLQCALRVRECLAPALGAHRAPDAPNRRTGVVRRPAGHPRLSVERQRLVATVDGVAD